MSETILLGQGDQIIEIPLTNWEQGVSAYAQQIPARLSFMSADHHRVRNFAVRELPNIGKPLSPEFIADKLNLPVECVNIILEDLEKHLTFLFRNEQGAVAWAYPVTTDTTPHHVTFSTGEQLHAAWAIDAIATPFVQGRLREKPLSVVVRTKCAYSSEPIIIEIDSEFKYRIVEGGKDLLVFVPHVDFAKLADPSIIDAFWRKSIFFWSEEQARKFRARTDHINGIGIFLTLEQSVHQTRVLQSALFAFK